MKLNANVKSNVLEVSLEKTTKALDHKINQALLQRRNQLMRSYFLKTKVRINPLPKRAPSKLSFEVLKKPNSYRKGKSNG